MLFNRLLNEFSKALFDDKRLVAMSFILKSCCFINVKIFSIHFGLWILTIPLPYYAWFWLVEIQKMFVPYVFQ